MANDAPGGLGSAQPIQVDPDALMEAANYISGLADSVRAERSKVEQSHGIAVQGWVEPISRNAYEHWHGTADEQLGQRETELRELAAHLAQTAQSFRQADAADTGGHGAGGAGVATVDGELVTGGKSPSQILSDNIIASGNAIHPKGTLTQQPPGTSAHHIVPFARNYPSANAARALLAKYGIGLNDANNGVFMWTDPAMYPGKHYYHKGTGVPDLHTNVYYDNVQHDLEATEQADLAANPPKTPAQIKVDLEATLQKIGASLRAGSYQI